MNHPQVSDGADDQVRLTFLQLFDQLLDRAGRQLRTQQLAVVTLALQVAFGVQFYAEESDDSKWKGGEPPDETTLSNLVEYAWKICRMVLHEQGQSPSADTLNAEASDSPAQGEKDDAAVAGDSAESAAGGSGTVAQAQPAARPAPSHLTFEEAYYWLQQLKGDKMSEPTCKIDPERPSLLFYEKVVREAKAQDLNDPNFHLIERDAGTEELEKEDGAGEESFFDPVLKKNRLRGGAKGRQAQMGWSYKPRVKLPRLMTDLQQASEALEGSEKELRFLVNRREEETALHEKLEGSGEANPACAVCFEDDKELSGVLKECLHSFCMDCIERLLDRRETANCPSCRRVFRKGDVRTVTRQKEAGSVFADLPEDDQIVGDYGRKIRGLIKDLRIRLSADPTAKAVVFTQYRKMLVLVQDALLVNGIGAVRLGGSEQEQAEALATFRDKDLARVLLVPMKASEGAAGLTLTMAQYAYLLEPGLDPGVHQQAESRISRIGQQRPTTTIRVRMKNTIETHIARIAARKVDQRDTTDDGVSRESITMNDLAAIFDVDVAKEQAEAKAERLQRRQEIEQARQAWEQRLVQVIAAFDEAFHGVTRASD